MKKHLLTIFALSAVTWACFALSIVVCRGEIAATIASARGIKAVHLQTLNSAITGLPGEEQQSILRREGFSSLPQLQQQLPGHAGRFRNSENRWKQVRQF